jgi:alanine-synthesizing transaminase
MPATQTHEILAAKRLDNVRYAIRDLACFTDQVTKQGHKVLALNVGDPLAFDFETPAYLIEAVYKAMRDGKNGYSPSSGIKPALEAIRREAETKKGILNIRDIFITTGVSETVDVCLTALLNPGENVLTPCPDYPLYSAVLAKIGANINTYYLNEDDAWQPDLEDLKKKLTPRTRGIVLINPNNPTGAICSRGMLEKIAEFAREHNLVVFADEIYDKLMIDGDTHIPIYRSSPSADCRKIISLPDGASDGASSPAMKPRSRPTSKASTGSCVHACAPIIPSSTQLRPHSMVRKITCRKSLPS